MDIVITYLAPKTGGHSGSIGKQSQMHFSSFEDSREWVLGNIPEPERRRIKLWANGLQITGATRASVFLPLAFNWRHPERLF